MTTTEMLAQAMKDLLAKIRRDAPELSGKLMGHCDQVLATWEAEKTRPDLPPLPEAAYTDQVALIVAFSEDQMRDYARAALAAWEAEKVSEQQAPQCVGCNCLMQCGDVAAFTSERLRC